MSDLALSLAILGVTLLVSAAWQVIDLVRIRRHNAKVRHRTIRQLPRSPRKGGDKP